MVVQTILGLILLGSGYYLAQSVQSPVNAIVTFFVAVILVIVATYLLFNAGIITFLHFLKGRPSYYYKPTNFISVSNLIFRMRKNAMGLATITILSTMVLVTLVGGINIFTGGYDYVSQQNPSDFRIELSNVSPKDGSQNLSNAERVQNCKDGLLEKANLGKVTSDTYIYRMKFLKSIQDEQLETVDQEIISGNSFEVQGLMYIFSVQDYQKMTGKTIELLDGQALFFGNNVSLKSGQALSIDGQKVTIKDVLSENFLTGKLSSFASMVTPQTYYFVVPDVAAYLDSSTEQYYIAIDSDLSDEEQISRQGDFSDLARKGLDATDFNSAFSYSARSEMIKGFFALAGSLFFIGMFLSLAFLIAAILVIYYKQISEAYEDRDRFVILQKVGLDKSQTKRSISKQVLTVFFLPIGMAVLHLAFAYKMLYKILILLGVTNEAYMLQVTVLTVLGYVGIYLLVYMITSKSYHRIIEQ
ncbi:MULTISPECIES: FtsX-like permease family protein [unclassified Streptococcus]|uniref:ABC transporter permease n=1 Tax=unclassified Streptococcus TaxID=2608887 RepID=UPI000AFEFEDD|nr:MULTISPECIES: FtsX-like permease family protein [unclassified Streptococcus]